MNYVLLSNEIDFLKLVTPSIVQKSHDHYTRGAIRDLDILKPLLKMALPSEIFNKINKCNIRMVDTSLIDTHNLTEFRADAIIAVEYDCDGEKQDIFIIIEHKSYAGDDPDLQAIKYKVVLWENLKVSNEDEDSVGRTPIISMTLSHGKAKVNLGKKFSDSYRRGFDSILVSSLLDYVRYNIDFRETSINKFRQNFKIHLFATTLKNSHEPLKVIIDDFVSLLREYPQKTILENYNFIVYTCAYIRSIHKELAEYEILNKIKPEILRRAFMSSLETLLEKKGKEGLAKGKKIMARKMAKMMKEHDCYSIKDISRETELTEEEIMRL